MEPAKPPTEPLPARPPVLLPIVAGVLGLVMLVRMGVALSRQSRLTNESGIWCSLAIDYAHGVLYRPLIGPLGYGGTRYFPLHVLAQGSLMRLGLGPVAAGYAIIVAGAALLLIGMYLLMRRLDVPPALASSVALLATGTGAAEIALTTIRGDLLPAALNVLGLACAAAALGPAATVRDLTAVPRPNAWRWAAAAGALFALAFLTKATTLFGPLATVVAFWLARRRVLAGMTAAAFAAVAVPGLALVQWRSHGQFSANFAACASAGGAFKWNAEHLPQTVVQVVVQADPIGCIATVIGAAAFLAVPAHARLRLPGVAVVTTTLATLAMFMTPGIFTNHLIDLQVILLVFTAVAIAHAPPAVGRAGTALLTAFGVAAIANGYLGFLGDLPHRADKYREIVRRATAPAAGPGPMLTDFELFSVLQAKSPVVLDDFMMTVVAPRFPAVRTDLYRRLDGGDFAAVVLKADPTQDFRRKVWGDAFPAHLSARYDIAFREGQFTVYWRRPAAAPRDR
jgi:hypothetical protein